MTDLKMTLVDNDYKIQAEADLDVKRDMLNEFKAFVSRIKEELVTGQTACLVIEGEDDSALQLSVSMS